MDADVASIQRGYHAVRVSIAPHIDDPIARLIARGAAAHPDVPEPPGLRDRLAMQLAHGSAEVDIRAADIYLATACIAGDTTALARLELELPTTVRAVVARLGVPSEYADVAQRVRLELLVRDEAGHCGLARYTGRGELRAYLRTVAVRAALRLLDRRAAPADEPGALLALVVDTRDSPELALLKQRCRDGVRAGFAAGLAALTPVERTLLRQHYVDGLSIDVLGRIHRTHRSTCARWIEAARVKILRGIRRHLRTTQQLDPADLEIAVALVHSQLDLSLSRQLASNG